MQKVLTAAEMREVDRLTTERYGIPSIILMENAAHAVAQVITAKLGGSVNGKGILFFCGKGNNGGDGASLARILWQQGARCLVYLFGKTEDTKGDARINFEILQKIAATQTGYFNFGERFLHFVEVGDVDRIFEEMMFTNEDACVDALFGTGFSGELEGDLLRVVEKLQNQRAFGRKSLIISIDIPSGVNSDNTTLNSDLDDSLVEEQARVSHVAFPDVTVTFTAPKMANVLPPASRVSKELVVADIGSPRALIEESPSNLFVTEISDVQNFLRSTFFKKNSYKNKRGHALIIAGSENYAGAATLCGNAAIRSGVGLVTIGTPRSSKDLVGGRVVPEVMVRPLAETESGAISEEAIAEIGKFSKSIDAIAIGAGLSASDESTGRFVRHFLENRTMPTLLDADALTLLSPFQRVSSPHGSKGSTKDKASLNAQDPPVILTPHEGEFMRLLGTDDKEAIKDRVGAVRKFAQEKNVILVLKGERVLIGEPGGKVVVNPTGNSGLGKAGNGDTLLGILTGFAAQAAAMDIDMFETMVAGVYIAGLAGDIAAEKFGKRVMTASDTRDCLAEAFRRCEETNN